MNNTVRVLTSIQFGYVHHDHGTRNTSTMRHTPNSLRKQSWFFHLWVVILQELVGLWIFRGETWPKKTLRCHQTWPENICPSSSNNGPGPRSHVMVFHNVKHDVPQPGIDWGFFITNFWKNNINWCIYILHNTYPIVPYCTLITLWLCQNSF